MSSREESVDDDLSEHASQRESLFGQSSATSTSIPASLRTYRLVGEDGRDLCLSSGYSHFGVGQRVFGAVGRAKRNGQVKEGRKKLDLKQSQRSCI